MGKHEKNNAGQGPENEVGGIAVENVFLDETVTLPPSLSEDEIGIDEGVTEAKSIAEIECLYEKQFNACLALAFDGVALDMLTDWGAIPFTLACFYADNMDAPVHAGLMQVKLRHGVIILPDQDPRRVELALQLFRAYKIGVNSIVNADSEVQPALMPSGPSPSREKDGPFDREDERFALSDIGKSAAAREMNEQ